MAPTTKSLAIGIASKSLDDLIDQEKTLTLSSFTADDAWHLGLKIREALANFKEIPAVVNITLANSNQLLFHATSGPGTAPDNDIWVARKRKTVLRWGHSSWYMHVKMSGDEAAFREKYALGNDAGSYAIHGGGYPVRVKGVESVVAVIVVSGLAQEADHGIITFALKEYLRETRPS